MLSVALQLLSVVTLLVLCAQRDRLTSARRRALWALPAVALSLSLILAYSPHVLRKWLARLAMPHGWFFLILLAAAAWLWWSGRRREAIVATAVLTLYAAVGNVWVSHALLGQLEEAHAAPRPGDEPFDAVILLGGGAGVTPEGVPQLGTSGDRLAVAARLYHQGLTPRLVCTGSSIAGLNRPVTESLGQDSRALLGAMGVPPEAVMELDGPQTTSEELAALAERIPAEGWRRVGLVTSAWHLPRATRLAERAGLSLVAIAADYRTTPAPINVVHLLPSAEGFGNTRLFVWEILGMLAGR